MLLLLNSFLLLVKIQLCLVDIYYMSLFGLSLFLYIFVSLLSVAKCSILLILIICLSSLYLTVLLLIVCYWQGNTVVTN